MQIKQKLYFQVGVIYSAALILAMIGCAPPGKQAMSNYGGLEGTHRPELLERAPDRPANPELIAAATPQPTTTTTSAREDLIVFRIVDDLVFEENIKSSKKLLVKINDPSVKFNLVIESLPNGAKLIAPTAQEPGVWQLEWTAPLGTITQNQKETKIKLNLEIKVENEAALKPDLKAELEKMRSRLKQSTEIRVVANDEAPVVKRITMITHTGFEYINNGTAQIAESKDANARIRIVIYDPTSKGRTNTADAPRLFISYDKPNNSELFIADASSLIKGYEYPAGHVVNSNPCEPKSHRAEITKDMDVEVAKDHPEGHWAYTLYVDVRNRQVPIDCSPRTKAISTGADSVWTRFDVQAESRINRVSSAKDSVNFKIIYNSKAKFLVDDKLQDVVELTFQQGTAQEQGFTITTLSERGIVNIDQNSLSQITKLGGTPKISCENPSTITFCKMTWNPPCQLREPTESIAIRTITNLKSEYLSSGGSKVTLNHPIYNQPKIKIKLLPAANGTCLAARQR